MAHVLTVHSWRVEITPINNEKGPVLLRDGRNRPKETVGRSLYTTRCTRGLDNIALTAWL